MLATARNQGGCIRLQASLGNFQSQAEACFVLNAASRSFQSVPPSMWHALSRPPSQLPYQNAVEHSSGRSDYPAAPQQTELKSALIVLTMPSIEPTCPSTHWSHSRALTRKSGRVIGIICSYVLSVCICIYVCVCMYIYIYALRRNEEATNRPTPWKVQLGRIRGIINLKPQTPSWPKYGKSCPKAFENSPKATLLHTFGVEVPELLKLVAQGGSQKNLNPAHVCQAAASACY